MVSPETIGHGRWKYVVFSDGSIGFCDANNYGNSHQSDIIDEAPDKTPVTAGTIQVSPDNEWFIQHGGSLTAKPVLYQGRNDEEKLKKILSHLKFNYKLIYRY